MIYDICIIGAGASGMAAAICAARNGASIVLLERMTRPGKKILATGNGKCNLSNTALSSALREPCYEQYYRGRQPAFARDALSSFSAEDLLQFMSSIGVYTHTRDSYIYPRSDQASSVRHALEMALQETDLIRLITEVNVTDISVTKTDGTAPLFCIRTDHDTNFCAKKLILSAGGCAAPKQGSDGSGYELAKRMGHKIIFPLPALTALHCEEKYMKELAGIRCQARVSLHTNKKMMAEDQGELQLTSYGISGIPVFQVSRFAAVSLYKGKAVTVIVDFFPDMQRRELTTLIKAAATAHPAYNMPTILAGIMNDKLALVLSRLAWKEYKAMPAARWSGPHLARLLDLMKEHTLHISGTNSFDQAQVCCGGVDTSQIDPQTMESRLVPGLYITGELLDIDGICGGFNLHWAFATGCTAGRSASRRRRHD